MGNTIKELLSEIDEALEITKEYNRFVHLFSDDDAKKTIAKLRRTVNAIKFKAEASQLKEYGFPEGKPIKEDSRTGKFVSIRPCGEKYQDKTYLGILIGDAALSSSISIKEDAIICSWSYFNPAILVPELGKVIYGCESWWGEIESEEDLKNITDLDIESIWYVKALKSL